MGKVLKPSIYNKLVLNLDKELILYNSYSGAEKICKIKDVNKKYVREVLQNKYIYFNKNNEILKKLYKLGYLVDREDDEYSKKRLMYMESVTENVLHLTILPTRRCNFRCIYCYETFKEEDMNDDVQQGIINYVKENIRDFKGLYVSWFGGEPLEAMDIIEKLSEKFIRICNLNNKEYYSSITTNGFNLNLKNFKKLIDLKVNSFQITIDGLSNTHDKQRILKDGSKTFNKIFENLKNIKSTSEKFNIILRSNITKEILSDFDNYLEFFNKNFGNDSRISMLIRPVEDWGGNNTKALDKLISKKEFKEIYNKMINCKFKINCNVYMDLIDSKGSVCYAGKKNSYVIDQNGVVYKCTVNFELDENKIGYVNKEGVFINEWKNARWLIEKEEFNECKKCEFSCSCLANSCPAKLKFGNKNAMNCVTYEKKILEQIILLIDKMHELKRI